MPHVEDDGPLPKRMRDSNNEADVEAVPDLSAAGAGDETAAGEVERDGTVSAASSTTMADGEAALHLVRVSLAAARHHPGAETTTDETADGTADDTAEPTADGTAEPTAEPTAEEQLVQPCRQA